MANGWTGNILRVNLTTGNITLEDSSKFKKFVGGMGFGYKIMYDEVPPGTMPFDEGNKLVFATGPLTGSGAPCSSRVNITSLSTFTKGNLVVDAHMGGFFAAQMKFAGYDAIIIEGKSATPVWINIKDEKVSIESGLDKVQDFAMEFYSDGQGTVRYEGLSVFNTEERGSYTGNILEEQSTMLSRITRFTGEETYSRIQEAVRSVLQEVYGSTYAGCIGVDMLVYRQKDGSFAIHPCIEINMRYTMGMVALRLFQHYVAPRAVGDYRVSYEKEAGEALEKHRLMSETYPLRFANGRIQEGYLSLCPVTKDTHYRAYLLLM